MGFLRRNLGWMVVIILAAIPAVFWLTMMPLQFRFGSLTETTTSLGQLSGLMGMALFSIVLTLGARLKFFDRHLRGLNVVYVNHHRLGAVAFILLLFHPLFLAAQYLQISTRAAALFFLSGRNWAINFGIASLLAMMALLVLTFFVALRYDIWKNTHKFMGAAFFLGGLHSLLIFSDISRYWPLRYYMLALFALGIGAYVYHTILGRWVVRRYLYAVEEIKSLNEAVVAVTLSPFDPRRTISYAPGQFAFVNFTDRRVGVEQHPFSFVSAPEERSIKFVIKNLGDYTGRMPQLSRGTLAKIEGPYGKFSFLNVANKKQIWIAGGIGITPFMSMAHYLVGMPDAASYAIDLYYCARNESEMVLLDELSAIAKQCPAFRVIKFCSDTQGHISARAIFQRGREVKDRDVFLCGPSAMMKSLRAQFVQLGTPNARIHSEEFSF